MEPLKPSYVTQTLCFASEFDEAQEVSVGKSLWLIKPVFSVSNIGLVFIKLCEG